MLILPLQSLHASPPCPPIPIQGWKEPHGGTGNGLFEELAKVSQGFAGHNLVGVDEAKPSYSHIPGFSDAGEFLTIPNVYGNFTPLSAILFILTALILRTIFDSMLLWGGIQDFRKTLSVQAIAANSGSYHPWWMMVTRNDRARSLLGRKAR